MNHSFLHAPSHTKEKKKKIWDSGQLEEIFVTYNSLATRQRTQARLARSEMTFQYVANMALDVRSCEKAMIDVCGQHTQAKLKPTADEKLNQRQNGGIYTC